MIPLALALSLFLAGEPAAEAAPAETAPAVDPMPFGAPREDYQFVGWCYGALKGYLDLHDEVMPEVTRIESQFRRPGSNLADDLKVYADQQHQAQTDLKRFQTAMTAAEKASLKPIQPLGAKAIARGEGVWSASASVSKARLAQEWMSWTLPARCQTVASTLQKRAKLMGATLQVNADGDAAGDAAPAPVAAADAADAQRN